MKEEKKFDFVFDISTQLQNQIKQSKLLKYGVITATLGVLIVVVGFASKV